MKIVCIAYLHGFGGAEKQIIMLANGLADLGHSVTLISVSDDKPVTQLIIMSIILRNMIRDYCYLD